MICRDTLRLVALFPCLFAAPLVASAGIAFLDDFEDGDHADGAPVTWAPLPAPFDQGTFEVAEGSFVLSPSTAGPSIGFNYWEADAFVEDQSYHDVSIRTQVRALAEAPTLAGIGVFDTEAINGTNIVGCSGVTILDAGAPYLSLGCTSPDGTWNQIGELTTTMSHVAEDLNLRLDILGSFISLSAWPDGSSEPDLPQLFGRIPEELVDFQGQVSLLAGTRRPSVPVAYRSVEVKPAIGGGGSLQVLPSVEYSVRDDDSDGVLDDLGDIARVSGTLRIGEYDSPTINYMGRAVSKFALPDVPDLASRLESATLWYWVSAIRNNPSGPVSVWHSTTDNDLDILPSDFEDLSYQDTLRDLVQPTDDSGVYYGIDVTDQVLADVLGDGASPLSAFRFQVNDAQFLDDNINQTYTLWGSSSTVHPATLTLKLVPEPSTLHLALGAIAIILSCIRSSAVTTFKRR